MSTTELQAVDNTTGEMQSLDQVRAFRLQCLEQNDVAGALDAEKYCAAVAQLRAKEAGMTEWANKWNREAVEFAAAIGAMLGLDAAKGRPAAGGNTAGAVITDIPQQRQSDYRAIARVPADVREDFYSKAEESGDTISKSGVRRLGKKQAREDGIREQVAAINSGAVALPAGKFSLIDIDPPWPYAESGGDASGYDAAGHRASNPYPEMSLEEIAALPVPEHAADDCVLWLWTTHRFMRHAFPILDQWGFRDRAILTWAKDRMGLGRWLRSQSEFCIMATRGKPLINLTNQTTILHGPMREHSRKPDAFYAMVEELCPAARRLIWFGRETHRGWHVGGNEPEKFDGME